MTNVIDLHIDWPLQYSGESTTFDARFYPARPDRLVPLVGYLQTTRAAFVACTRSAADWEQQPDRWAALNEIVARVEAEFSGRLLIGPDDWARWHEPGESLTWAVLGIGGFDHLVRDRADLDRWPALWRRGVRRFVLTEGGKSRLVDDAGLTELGREGLDRLAGLAESSQGPLPAVDLARVNRAATAAILDWFEAVPLRAERLVPMVSPTAIGTEPHQLDPEHLGRLRAIGGVIGLGLCPPWHAEIGPLHTSIVEAAQRPFLDQFGFAGLGFATDYLGLQSGEPSSILPNVPAVVGAFKAALEPAPASALLDGSGRSLIARLVGVTSPSSGEPAGMAAPR